MEGYFSIKITVLGENKYLLEEVVEGELKMLVEGARDWLSQCFSETREWRQYDMDNEQLTWIRFYGIPCHA